MIRFSMYPSSFRSRLLALGLGATVAASAALAQSSTNIGYSSSADQSLSLYHTQGQNSGGYGNGGYKQYPKYGQPSFHHLAIVGGAGFDAPVGNTKNTQTFGYNIKAGAGYNFSRHFGVLGEFDFHRTGIPNSVLAASQAPQGNVHIFGISVDPIYYFKTTGVIGGYVTGGVGWTHKSTSFTQPVYLGIGCNYYGYCYPQYGNITLSQFSSDQLGLNVGAGVTHNLGDGGAKVFAEARYLFVNSPGPTPTRVGSGTVSMIPVTLGIRF